MRFVDEYRNPKQVMPLIEALSARARALPYNCQRPLRIMEVCGGHTHAIFKFGLDRLLPENIEFIHGPGCPVCVLPMGRIDACIDIASRPEVIFCTFGDAMRVPGRSGSLLSARARGADIRILYSPADALAIARQNPNREIVLFGLGFETTMPATAVTLQRAWRERLTNFTLFCQHITLPPVLQRLLTLPDHGIDAFLAPGHVSMITGTHAYDFIAGQYRRPVAIAGFEPLDLLQSVLMLVSQKITGACRVENQYRRIVPEAGNIAARRAMDEVFEVRGGAEWRGLGTIDNSNVQLRGAYRQFDAEQRFHPNVPDTEDNPASRCGDVLTGRCKPTHCPLFGTRCTPHNAFGALMVSSEGACSAWYQYRAQESEV